MVAPGECSGRGTIISNKSSYCAVTRNVRDLGSCELGTSVFTQCGLNCWKRLPADGRWNSEEASLLREGGEAARRGSKAARRRGAAGPLRNAVRGITSPLLVPHNPEAEAALPMLDSMQLGP